MRNSITGTANITNSKKTLAANSDKKEETVQFMWSEGCVPKRGLTHSWNTSRVPKVYLHYFCLLSFCHGSSMCSTDLSPQKVRFVVEPRVHFPETSPDISGGYAGISESGDLQIPFVSPLLVITPPLLLIHVRVSPAP